MRRFLIVIISALLAALSLCAEESKPTDKKDGAPTQAAEPSVGKAVGKAVNQVMTALTDDGQRLADSEVGRFTIFMVGWKVMGSKVVRYCVGLPLMWTLVLVWWWSYRRNCLRRRVLEEETDSVRRWRLVAPDENRALAHGCMLLGILIVSYLVLFV